MELSFKNTSLFLAILLTGLSAGLFYAWEVSVIPGTRRIPDRSYLETMQSINRAILNPAFFVVFFGSLLFLLGNSYLQYKEAVNLSFWIIAGATITYLIGTLGVTVMGNVPMNEALDAVNLNDLKSVELHHTRMAYEGKWNQWHSVRTVFSVLAFILSILAAFIDKSNNNINFIIH